jgi:hypothetical protein
MLGSAGLVCVSSLVYYSTVQQCSTVQCSVEPGSLLPEKLSAMNAYLFPCRPSHLDYSAAERVHARGIPLRVGLTD